MAVPTLLAFILLTVLPAGHAGAQAVDGGVKGGITFAKITDLEDSFAIFCIALAGVECPRVVNESRAGATFGGFLTLRASDRFALQGEVLFTQKGTTIRLDSDVLPASLDLDLDVDVRLNYLEVPVLGRFDLARGGTGAYLFAGPVFGFNLSASAEGGPGALFAGFTGDIEEAVETFELAVTVGGGFQFRGLLLEGRFTQGLTDVNQPSLALVTDVRNRAFAVLAGVRF